MNSYQGKAGQTTQEYVHVPADDGRLTSLEVYTAINVATHPHLRELALVGDLHRFDELSLAIPFIYHDPAEQGFALVLPVSLCHRELQERSRLFALLANDPMHPVPDYVRDGPVVIGVEGLKAYLNGGEPSDGMPLSEDEVDDMGHLEAEVEQIVEEEDVEEA